MKLKTISQTGDTLSTMSIEQCRLLVVVAEMLQKFPRALEPRRLAKIVLEILLKHP